MKPEKHTIPPKDIFKFIDALDAYEIDKKIEETLVVDITEITNDGLVETKPESNTMSRFHLAPTVEEFHSFIIVRIDDFWHSPERDIAYDTIV